MTDERVSLLEAQVQQILARLSTAEQRLDGAFFRLDHMPDAFSRWFRENSFLRPFLISVAEDSMRKPIQKLAEKSLNALLAKLTRPEGQTPERQRVAKAAKVAKAPRHR